jgi:hypothetical protein
VPSTPDEGACRAALERGQVWGPWVPINSTRPLQDIAPLKHDDDEENEEEEEEEEERGGHVAVQTDQARASPQVCGANLTGGSFWNHSRCTTACCATYWGASHPAECCEQCRATGIGPRMCAAWEWTAEANTCYLCTREVLAYRGRLVGHITGCVDASSCNSTASGLH